MRRVGAMRGLISLALIFFVALSAQASAKTFIKCKGRSITSFPSGERVGSIDEFYIGYDLGNGSKIQNLMTRGIGCRTILKTESDEARIVIYCGRQEEKETEEEKIITDRITGDFLKVTKWKKFARSGETEMWTRGSCYKAKPKF